MLTTVDAEGALASRPMTVLQMDAQGALWFFVDVKSPKVDRLRAVNLSFVDGDQSAYVSLSGHGEIDSDRFCQTLVSRRTQLGKPGTAEIHA
jgi:general stress protein 26